jgi:hypothetical protein
MHQPGPMRGGQPAQHRAQHRGHGVWRHRATFGQQLAQRAALDELHHQKRMAGVQTLVVDRDQPGILQPGDRAGLELEAGQELVVAGVARVHHLERDGAVEPGIQAAVHRRRTAAGDFGLDEVAPVEQGAVQRITAARSGHGAIVGVTRWENVAQPVRSTRLLTASHALH